MTKEISFSGFILMAVMWTSYLITGYTESDTFIELDRSSVELIIDKNVKTSIGVLPVGEFAHKENKPVIAVTGISHESNSFSSQSATLERFGARIGEDPADRKERFFSGANSTTRGGGYIDGAEQFGLVMRRSRGGYARHLAPICRSSQLTTFTQISHRLWSNIRMYLSRLKKTHM